MAQLHEAVLQWYAVRARPLPWREPDTTPWGVFVSETAVGVFTLWLFSRGRWKVAKV